MFPIERSGLFRLYFPLNGMLQNLSMRTNWILLKGGGSCKERIISLPPTFFSSAIKGALTTPNQLGTQSMRKVMYSATAMTGNEHSPPLSSSLWRMSNGGKSSGQLNARVTNIWLFGSLSLERRLNQYLLPETLVSKSTKWSIVPEQIRTVQRRRRFQQLLKTQVIVSRVSLY